MKFTSVTSQRVIGSGETGKSNDFFFFKTVLFSNGSMGGMLFFLLSHSSHSVGKK